jgi:hypothetical protein
MRLMIIARSCVIAGGILGVAAGPVIAAPEYSLLQTIAVPTTSANNQGGAMTAFDISFVDPVTGDYYFADRSNASVDVINGATNQYITQIGGFTGQQSTTSVSGPDGVLVEHSGATATLFAGDGGSVLRSFNVTNAATPTVLFAPISTGGGPFRVDEMSYSPTTQTLMVANNANTPAYATLINATTGTISVGNIQAPFAAGTDGMEQSVWNPNTNTFFVSLPAIAGSAPGGVMEVDTSGHVVHVYNFGTLSGGAVTSCSPAGLALGGSGFLMVGCGNAHTQTVVLDPTANGGNGAIVTTLAGISGSDELWYDPVTGDFYVTGVDASGDRVIDIVSDNLFSILQSINLSALGAGVNAHSVAVNPLNGEIFVPLEGTTTAATDSRCPNGCVAVFAPVPEPSSLPLLAVAAVAVAGIATRLGRQAARS